MRRVTLLALLALPLTILPLTGEAQSPREPAARTDAPRPREAAPEREAAGGAATRTAPGPRVGERRRNSYAACNRESHKRSLRGGARRRFLIQCKLGIERRPAHRAAEPSATGRRP